jgi:hypothetical protein
MFTLPSIRPSLLALARGRAALQRPAHIGQTRGIRQVLAPTKAVFIKRHKGVLPVPTGGSLKGTTLIYGDYGLRVRGDAVRLSAKTLKTIYENIRRRVKVAKGCKVHLRVFPDIPVCVKVCRPSCWDYSGRNLSYLGKRNTYG